MQINQAGFLQVGGKALAPFGGLLFLAAAAWGQTGTSTLADPTVTFSSPGVKQVVLEVCNEGGCDSITKEIVVLDPKPHILSIASIPPLVGSLQNLAFSAEASGRPALTYRWNLTGADSLALAGNPAPWDLRTAAVGSYTGHLEVQNADGAEMSAPFSVRVARMTFSDVLPTHWAWRSVESIYDQGITRGCAAGPPPSYCPLAVVSRAEMAVFLVRAIHGSSFVPPVAVGFFSDVSPSYWAARHIEQLYQDGITTGCATSPTLQYCPTNNVTRAEMAIFLLRAKYGPSYTPPPATGTLFADVPADYRAAAWIEQLAIEGITTGCATAPLRYCPEETVSRAQMAVFLSRTFNVPLIPFP